MLVLRVSFAFLTLTAALAPATARADDTVPAEAWQNCSFRNEPTEFELRAFRARRDAVARTRFVTRSLTHSIASSDAEIPRRNFIDQHIFSRLAAEGAPPAALATDEEFLRRVSLDLTGRAPSPAAIRAFLADTSPDKRARAIDALLHSEAFVEKWTLWLGDLLQNAAFAANRNQQPQGRNAMHDWIRASIAGGKSFRDIAYETIATTGNNFDRAAPGVNFMVRAFAPMGPAQDTYDMMLVRTATTFLGMGHYDCVLCHDGRRHLDTVSAWGAEATREQAQKMAAFFARTQLQPYRAANREDPYFNSNAVVDLRNGAYQLNTTSGNRPPRIAAGGVRFYTPVYRDGREPGSGTWRESFVALLLDDPMFARNLANRLWLSMFNLALAEPVDALDPHRLDPAVAPPPGWTHQASHPQLLEDFALWLRSYDYNLREALRLLAESSAYQLSSRYEHEWDITRAALFARHIPRRLEGEEVHDILLRATGVPVPNGGYQVQGWAERIPWAMQLPDPTEPRNVRLIGDFLNSFQRGNRDTVQRSQSGSILMMLQLMNSPFVNDRLTVRTSPFLRSLRDAPGGSDVVDELFLAFLARFPSDHEKSVARKTMESAPNRAQAIEDLAWALVNKTDFLFSY